MAQATAHQAKGVSMTTGGILSVGGLAPRHGWLDATWIVGVFLPLYFGAAYGDAAYGLVMLAVVYAVRLAWGENAKVRLVTSVLGRAAALAVVFGLLYSQVLDGQAGWEPLLSRVTVVELVGLGGLLLLAAQAILNVAAGILNSLPSRRREDAWAPAMDFAAFVTALAVVFLGIGAAGGLLDTFARSFVGISGASEQVFVIGSLVLTAILIAAGTLLADFVVRRNHRTADE